MFLQFPIYFYLFILVSIYFYLFRYVSICFYLFLIIYNYSKKSFTLIELLIVVSIILLFSGLSLASYHQFSETKKLEAETKKLVEILELAKKKINSGDKENLGNNSSCDLTAYKVVINSSNEVLIQATVCRNKNLNCPIQSGCSDVNIFTYTFPQGITLSLLNSVVFYPFGKTFFYPTPSPPATFGCIKITNNASGKFQCIKVDSSGTITIVPSC